MRNAYRLKGTKVSVFEDLSDASQEKRNAQMDEFKAARNAGKIAYFNYTTLVTRERRNPQGSADADVAAGAHSGDAAADSRVSGESAESAASLPSPPNPASTSTFPVLQGVSTRSGNASGQSTAKGQRTAASNSNGSRVSNGSTRGGNSKGRGGRGGGRGGHSAPSDGERATDDEQ